MNAKFKTLTRAVALASIALTLPTYADLIHRYSFSESSGITVKDSVGSADGVLKGNGIAFDGSGQLYLNGGSSSSAAAADISGYVDLPNHIINVLTNVTFETWVQWDASGSSWQRIFDFGTSAGGEDISDGNGGYLFLSPQGDANIRFAVRDPATGTEPNICTASAPLEMGLPVCLTATYDYLKNSSRLYSNGVMVASSTASVDLKTINDVNNWLGRSQWGDPMFQGFLDEFRIYNQALSSVEVAASYVSGTETPSTSVASLGGVQAVHLVITKTALTEQDTVATSAKVDFAKISNFTLDSDSGAVFASSASNVATIDAKGVVTAVGAGTATISVTYEGKTDSVEVTVSPRLAGVVVAGTLFVDLHAVDAKNDTSKWVNRAGKGDFEAYGAPVYNANVGGTGLAGIEFNGVDDAYLGPLTTSELDGSSDRSIEVWAYNPSVRDEETLVELGHRGADNSNCSFNYGWNGTWGAVGQWGSADMGWNGAPAEGKWHYLVYTYDGNLTCKVYADGKLKATENLSTPLTTFASMPVRIAAQGDSDAVDFNFAQALSGAIGMVRVHTGALSDADVANNFLYGMEMTDPGTLNGITISLPAGKQLIGDGAAVMPIVTANFANRSYLDVVTLSTLSSSDTNIVTVGADGTLKAVKPGTATITASFRGITATKSVEVLKSTATLVHRYSFNDSVGSTTVKDSVGTANGTIKGDGAVFDGQQLTLPGGTGSADDPIAGYVDLPNRLISTHTNLTIETWITWNTSSGWQRIFDIGTSDGGEDISNGNGNYLFLSPAGSAALRFAIRDTNGLEKVQDTASSALSVGTEVYLAVTYNYDGNVSRVYSNGVMVTSGTAITPLNSINDVNVWLGRSQWGDPMFSGKFNEFRIWDGALSASMIAAAYAAGPNTLPTEETTKPSLSVAMSSGKVVVSWPDTAVGYQLQSSAVLGTSAAWTQVDASAATTANGLKSLSITPDVSAKFYRLAK